MSEYTYSQVLEASLDYFDGDEFAAKVFVDKYALQNQSGMYVELTPEDMHRRLAKEFARIESKYPNALSEQEIFDLLNDFQYIIPQGSPMSAIGNKYQLQSLSNCFVIQGVHSNELDSYGGIMLADQELAQIMKRRGGCGLDISGIRPKNAITANAAKTTDGIGVFMERFSNTCREVAQNGRRGAEMITISGKHPEVETFINIKRDLKKVTGANISIKLYDDFMESVKENKEYTLRWPADKSVEDAKITKNVKAAELWNQIVDSAWSVAEPGLLFWDNVKKTTPSDIYANEGYSSISTNPCFAEDTLIAVADGRNAVSIKQLAEEGKDVPVYSMNKQTGMVEIKTGRHPRITGHKQKLIRVHLDEGQYLDVTPNHNFILMDGTKKKASELLNGDSLPRFDKDLQSVKSGGKKYYQISCNTKDAKANKVYEHRMIFKFHNQEEWNLKYDSMKKNGFSKTGGIVIHHKDYNQLNNAPDNLQMMTFEEHAKMHGEMDNSGENNPRFSGYTNSEIKEEALKLTKALNRKFSLAEWNDLANRTGVPIRFSEFRKELVSPTHLARICAAEVGVKYIDEDPRLVKTYQDMLSQGYFSRIINHMVLVKKTCEVCGSEFEVSHLRRESSICSNECKNIYLNNNSSVRDSRNKSADNYNSNKMQKVRLEQVKIYSDLKFKLNRQPKLSEWEQSCKEKSITCRIGKSLKFGFKSFEEVVAAGNLYNHKVVRLEYLEGEHTVYNITVDDNHTVATITKINENNRGENSFSGIFSMNCGEVVLSKYDACRLLVVNLCSYVNNPFTEQASFDYDKFKSHVIIAQRLMDDIVDLEIECIDRILAKVHSDPEPLEVKTVEINLWNKIRETIINGRRTGLGSTAVGDTMAMLGIKYGSKESIDSSFKIRRM